MILYSPLPPQMTHPTQTSSALLQYSLAPVPHHSPPDTRLIFANKLNTAFTKPHFLPPAFIGLAVLPPLIELLALPVFAGPVARRFVFDGLACLLPARPPTRLLVLPATAAALLANALGVAVMVPPSIDFPMGP